MAFIFGIQWKQIVSCFENKTPRKGGCQGTGFLGIYYEKVIYETINCYLRFCFISMVIVYGIEMSKT